MPHSADFFIIQVKVFGSRVQVDSVAKVAELELAEKQKMKEKVGNKYCREMRIKSSMIFFTVFEFSFKHSQFAFNFLFYFFVYIL